DIAYLEEKRWLYTLQEQGATTLLVIHDYELPTGFTATRVELLIEIPSTYPDAKLDMFWVYPWIKVAATQQEPQAANVPREFDGKTWQRFSRHLNDWRPESDSLQTYLVWVRRHLEHDVRIAA
ncbi:MAG: hypothetical protein M3P18_21730, partial [Actinomycetota bacterium]|nr:hypothetical protein [Actinomycetota bacterium]